jgi:RHS repeat-associated protein
LVAGTDLADFGYTGHYVHKPSGLHLALYRAYDADLGRWLNRDPIAEAGGINLYGYVGNGAVNWVDPFWLALQPPTSPPSNIPVPRGGPDAKWVQRPALPGRRIYWVPDRPVPGNQPKLSFEIGGDHWDLVDGKQKTRFDRRGNSLTEAEAHSNSHRRPKAGPGSRCIGIGSGLLLGSAAGAAAGMDSAVSSGAFQEMLDAAQRGELTGDVVFDASIDAAIDTGNAGAFYGMNSGFSMSQMWNDFKNWLFGD